MVGAACPICLDVCDRRTVTACGHHFCSDCIHECAHPPHSSLLLVPLQQCLTCAAWHAACVCACPFICHRTCIFCMTATHAIMSCKL